MKLLYHPQKFSHALLPSFLSWFLRSFDGGLLTVTWENVMCSMGLGCRFSRCKGHPPTPASAVCPPRFKRLRLCRSSAFYLGPSSSQRHFRPPAGWNVFYMEDGWDRSFLGLLVTSQERGVRVGGTRIPRPLPGMVQSRLAKVRWNTVVFAHSTCLRLPGIKRHGLSDLNHRNLRPSPGG